VVEERVLTSLVNNGVAHPSVWAVDVPGSMTTIVEMWQEAVATNDGLLARLSSEDWARVVNFYGRHIPLDQACWFELFDHFTTGASSRSICASPGQSAIVYGPTADEPTMLPSANVDSVIW
jgi:hypothetical protein